MNRRFLICALLLIGVFFAGNGLCATYDATGEWDYTDSNHWNNCGEPNPGTEQGIDIIIQNGNNFTVIMHNKTITGTVSGNVYTATDTWYEDGGWTTGTLTVTASSNTQASGGVSWTWSGGGDTCSGGYQTSLTRKAQNPPTYDATGTWDYSDWNHWNNCGDPNDPSSSGTATLTQTGNRFTLVGDQQETFYGFVNGPNYTFARSYPEDNGTTSEVYRITLASGGTNGSGTGNWVWNDDYYDCNGGFNFSLVKQQQTWSISGTVSQLEGVLMTLSGDASGTTTTNASGNYSFGNLTNGNYTITPTKDGYRFEPASRNVTISDGDMTGIDFVAHQMAAAGPGIPLLLLGDE